jgi:hypothetical protein
MELHPNVHNHVDNWSIDVESGSRSLLGPALSSFQHPVINRPRWFLDTTSGLETARVTGFEHIHRPYD